jgi:hypothetical protein
LKEEVEVVVKIIIGKGLERCPIPEPRGRINGAYPCQARPFLSKKTADRIIEDNQNVT